MNGSVFRLSNDVCVPIAESWSRPFGIATLADGLVCVSHFTSDDPLTRRTAVSCWDGDGWREVATDLGSGVNGLGAASDGLWVVAWLDTPVERRNGRVSRIADGEVARQVDIDSRLPQFALELPTGELWVTVWKEDASGITGGEILAVSPGDRVVDATVEHEFEQPSGIARSEEGIWITDSATGELVLVSPEGRRLASHSGLLAPLGIAVDGEGNPLRRRVPAGPSHLPRDRTDPGKGGST